MAWATITAMAVVRRSLALDEHVADSVDRAAGEDGVSFSAWLSRAAEHALKLRDGLRAVENGRRRTVR